MAIIRHRFNRSRGFEHTDEARRRGSEGEHGGGVEGEGDTGRQLQSVVDRSDLDEMMHMAEMAERDFYAERGSAHLVLNKWVCFGQSFSSI